MMQTILALAFVATSLSCRTQQGSGSRNFDTGGMTSSSDIFPAPPYPPQSYAALYDSGFGISSFEYWPFIWKEGQAGVPDTMKNCIYPYPALVSESPNRYGYDGNTLVKEGSGGRKCMDKAYVRLFEIFKSPPQSCIDLKTAGGPSRFFMWVNDYSGAGMSAKSSCRPSAGLRNLWIYPEPPGTLIKWINEYIPNYQPETTDKGIPKPDADGCVLRTSEDLDNFCKRMIPVVKAAIANPGN